VSESDPRWEAKMANLEKFRAVTARASELGFKITTFGGGAPAFRE
jgi:hypothetical protein